MYSNLEKVGEKNLLEAQNNNIPYFKWINVEEKNTKSNEYVTRKYILSTQELAKYIKENLNYFFIRSQTKEEPLVFAYRNGYYQELSDNEFKAIIKSLIPYQLVKMHEVNEVFSNLKADFKEEDVANLDSEEFLINFQDGILDIRNMEFKEHSPKYLMTIQIPANYKDIQTSTEEAVVFHNYMNTLSDNNEEIYTFLMEYIAVAISNLCGFRAKCALFLVGKGNTGKSQLKKLVEKLVGEKNIATTDLEELNARFGTSNLFRKRLVGSSDMSFQRVTEMNIFKEIVGGDKVSIEFKGRTPFYYLFRGVLWFNCNQLPMFGGDKGDWVYERIIPIFCNNVIPKEKQDPYLMDKMWKERNAIIKEVLSYLELFIADKYQYRVPAISIEQRKIYEKENNTLLSFIDECCDVFETEIMASFRDKKSVFKRAYYKWCDNNNYSKGKMRSKEIEETLKEKFNEDFRKLDGYEVLRFIKIREEYYNELNIY